MEQSAPAVDVRQPAILAVGPDDAARITAHSRSAIYKAIAAGELQSFKVGKRRRVLMSELEVWINRIARENAR